jgi:uncharacterized transporter YbjL
MKLNEKAKKILALEAAANEEATRVQKIEALQALGIKISRKADKKRVSKKMEGAILEAGDFLHAVEQRRKAANRRKRNRRRK